MLRFFVGFFVFVPALEETLDLSLNPRNCPDCLLIPICVAKISQSVWASALRGICDFGLLLGIPSRFDLFRLLSFDDPAQRIALERVPHLRQR